MYDIILFDLGGVLVELVGSPFPLNEGRHQSSLADWFQSETAQRFELGKISSDAFVQKVKLELDIDATTSDIITTFASWPRRLYPGTNSMLEQLKQSHTLAVLSNTNELHESVLLGKFELNKHIEYLFFSHKMGVAKPDTAAFEYVLSKLNVKAEKVLFVDDNLDNVNAAKALGIDAHRTQGLNQVRSLMKDLNLL